MKVLKFIAASFAVFALSAQAAELDASQFEELVVGNKLLFAENEKNTVTLTKKGKLKLKWNGKSMKGTWTFDERGFCRELNKKEACQVIKASEDNTVFTFVSEDGREAVWRLK